MNTNFILFYFHLAWSDQQSYGTAIWASHPGGPMAQSADGQPIWPCCMTASHSMPNESKKITIHVHFFCKTCLVLTFNRNSPSNAWDRSQVPFASASQRPTHYIIKPSVRKNHLQQWPELDRMPGDQLGVVQTVPDGPVPCQSKPKHPHLVQSQSIRAQISHKTMM